MTAAMGTLVRVCALEDLTEDLGVAALIDGVQIALFRLADGQVYAVQNLDPFSDAYVMSRGITGSKGGQATIASPIYKQVFALATGECLATMDKDVKVPGGPNLATYPVTVDDGGVFVSVPVVA